jgi:hypothetical protein
MQSIEFTHLFFLFGLDNTENLTIGIRVELLQEYCQRCNFEMSLDKCEEDNSSFNCFDLIYVFFYSLIELNLSKM